MHVWMWIGISHMVIIMCYIINTDSANFKLASSLVDLCAPVLRVHKRRNAVSWSISRSEVNWRGDKIMKGLLKIVSDAIRVNPYSLSPEIRTAMVAALPGTLYKEIIKSVCI